MKTWYEYRHCPRLEKTSNGEWVIKVYGCAGHGAIWDNPPQLQTADREMAEQIYDIVKAAYNDGLVDGKAEVRDHLNAALGTHA